MFVSFSSIYAQEIWTQKDDFAGTARFGAVGFTIGDKGFVGTGFAYEGLIDEYSVDFWEYDPSEDVWTQKADFGGTGRSHGTGFSIGDRGYIGTGYYYDDGWQLLSDFWVYDSQSNTWMQKADFPGEARLNAVGLSIVDKGYIGTGGVDWDFGPWFKDFWEYNPETDSWEQKADFPGERRHGAVGFTIDDKGYVGTGYGDYISYKDLWEYNPDTDNWAKKADFGGTARSEAVGFSINGKGYIGTGRGMYLHHDFWEYNPNTDTWKRRADFSGAERYDAIGFSIGDKGYIGTGLTGPKSDFWQYDPSKDVLPHIPVLRNPANGAENIQNENLELKWFSSIDADVYQLQLSETSNFSTTIINQENIVDTLYTIPILGFNITYYWRVRAKNDFGESNWSEIWNFTTSKEMEPWVRKADFGGGSRIGAVGFTIGDKGYIGTGSATGLQKDFWEYDPQSDSWTQKADFGGQERQRAFGFSINDKGYIGAGYNALGGGDLKDFWRYEPTTNTWTRVAEFPGKASSDASGFSIGNKGYIGTGNYSDDGIAEYTAEFWEYDSQTDTWERKADFGGPARTRAVGFSIDDKGYIGTGYRFNGQAISERDFWQYDPETDTWTQKADIITGRESAVGFSISGKGYVGLGVGNNDFWEYDPVDNTWTRRADFLGPQRVSAVGFSIGGKGYIGTGSPNGEEFWEYDPSEDGVTSVGGGDNLVSDFKLFQNYPNPFNPTTRISYNLPERAHVKLEIFNAIGQRVAMLVYDVREASTYEEIFDASNLPSGIYIYRLEAGLFVESKKMLFIK